MKSLRWTLIDILSFLMMGLIKGIMIEGEIGRVEDEETEETEEQEVELAGTIGIVMLMMRNIGILGIGMRLIEIFVKIKIFGMSIRAMNMETLNGLLRLGMIIKHYRFLW
jgi:hypothetical protein